MSNFYLFVNPADMFDVGGKIEFGSISCSAGNTRAFCKLNVSGSCGPKNSKTGA